MLRPSELPIGLGGGEFSSSVVSESPSGGDAGGVVDSSVRFCSSVVGGAISISLKCDGEGGGDVGGVVEV